MLVFNKIKNQSFVCKIEVKGAGTNPTVIPRLILSPLNTNISLFFEGKIDDGQCTVVIPYIADIGHKGKAILEVIAESTVFKPWTDDYEIISENVVVEGVRLVETKPKISISVPKKEKIVNKPIKKQITEKFKYPEIFKKNCKSSTKKLVTEFIKKTKNISDVKSRNKLLEYIIKSYKPKIKTIIWAKDIFNNLDESKAKIAMYCYQIKEQRIHEDMKSKYPEVEEWDRIPRGSKQIFKAVTKKRWDEKKAQQFQSATGYNPAGYGFYDFKIIKNIDGTFTNTWTCSSSSD